VNNIPFQNGLLVFVDMDIYFKINDISDNIKKIFGIEKSSVIGKYYYDVFICNICKEFDKFLQDDKNEIEFDSIEIEINNNKYYLILYFAKKIIDNKLIGVSGYILNITDRKTREIAIEEEKKLLNVVIDESPNIILIKDYNGRFLLANQTLCDLYHTTKEDIVGKTDEDFNPNREQTDFYLQNIREVIDSKETKIIYEQSTDAKTNTTKYYQSIKKPIFENREILVIANDVTEIEIAKQSVIENEKRLSYVLDTIKEGIWDWNVSAGTLFHNRVWFELLGYEEEDFKGTIDDFMLVILEEDRDDIMKNISKSLKTTQQYKHEHRMKKKDGSTIWVYDRGNVVERDIDGNPVRMVGSFIDITDKKEAERKIKELNTFLEKKVEDNVQEIRKKDQILLHQAKLASMGEMINAIAHQWRQPLNAIGLLIQDIQDAYDFGELNRNYIEMSVDKAMGQINYMSSTIDSFRNFFRSCENTELFGAKETINEIVNMLKEQFFDSNIIFKVDGGTFLILGIRAELKQAIMNIINNSKDSIIKKQQIDKFYKGLISIVISKDKHKIEIIDNGVGINDDIIDRIFEPYFTTKHQAQGTGIALYMTKMAIDNMGGMIYAERYIGGAKIVIEFKTALA
jgi:PAS domain S-box-containing protein